MPFSSGAFGQLRYITESVIGTTPGTGNGVNLRNTGQSFKASVSTTSSKEVRADRLSTGLTRTDIGVEGGFTFELSGKEYDPFIEALLGSAYTHYGTLGLATIAGSVTAAANTFTSTTIPTTNLGLGQWFKVVPPAAASAAAKAYYADAWFKTHGTTPVSATVITLDPSTPVTAPGLGALGSGWGVSSSVVANGASLTRGFTFEYAMTDIAQFLPFRGCQANGMSLDIQVGSIVSGNFAFLGQSHVGMVGATTLPGSPVASQSLEVMNAVADIGLIYEAGASILTSTSSFIKSVKLDISNNMRAQKAVGVMGNVGVGLGELAITGTLEIYVPDAAYYTKWFNGVNTSLAIGMADAAGNGYLIELDKVTFKDGGLNPGGQSEDAMLTLPFQAFYNAATNRGIRITRAIAA